MPIPYYHVDVFSPEPLAGNGLIVFTETTGFTTEHMQLLTAEMRQFESIFLRPVNPHTVRARIFTCEEELNFAGHPVLGAAATLHDLLQPQDQQAKWTFELNQKTVHVVTDRKGKIYEGVMNQGKAQFGKTLNAVETELLLDHIGAKPEDLYPGLYPTVVSTGLSYLVVPLRDNHFKAKIGAPGLSEKLHSFGTQFIGLLDIATLSIRTGNNDGTVEDIATGSLAGPAGAFLVKHGLAQPEKVIRIEQGHNLGRKSELYVELKRTSNAQDVEDMDVIVSGSVSKIAKGYLEDGILG
jgi:PhzF family phenazine biosynthesis protein